MGVPDTGTTLCTSLLSLPTPNIIGICPKQITFIPKNIIRWNADACKTCYPPSPLLLHMPAAPKSSLPFGEAHHTVSESSRWWEMNQCSKFFGVEPFFHRNRPGHPFRCIPTGSIQAFPFKSPIAPNWSHRNLLVSKSTLPLAMPSNSNCEIDLWAVEPEQFGYMGTVGTFQINPLVYWT